jgi:hypothetical protein
VPTYHFANPETGEEFSIFMKIAELDEYNAANPHLRQIPTAPSIVDPVNTGITKPPSDFMKGVIGRIRDSAPGANKAAMERRWTVPKEI